MTLHTVNKSPYTSTLLQECLAIVGPHHAVLLIEDGIYGALESSPMAGQITALEQNKTCRFFVLADDLKARGIEADALNTSIKPIGYPEFVKLAVEHKNIQSWY